MLSWTTLILSLLKYADCGSHDQAMTNHRASIKITASRKLQETPGTLLVRMAANIRRVSMGHKHKTPQQFRC
jgi:hypothetical protein